MGKRKKSSRGPQGPKKREPLSTTFQCLFCNHENSVTVKLQKKEGVGQLSCKVCGQTFQTGINYLSAAVDVYSDWIDACEGVANQDGPDGAVLPATASYGDMAALSRAPVTVKSRAQKEENLDGFVEDDEGDAGEDYGED